ncbi:MAG: hypothetical protein H7Y18_19830 [Clostridiaceae bacterium]|nr:hypothetical protein [Clostridiaceae bacterium]
MKELLINIITKINNYAKVFINKFINSIKFESNKNGIIKLMYNSILEKKRKEKDNLLSELNTIKKELNKQNREINRIKEENIVYNKKIDALKSFQKFLLDSHS